MAPARGRPFSVAVGGGRAGEGAESPDGGSVAGSCLPPQAIPVNGAAPADVRVEHFVGQMLVIHENGGEPEAQGLWGGPGSPGALRGVVFQVQGRFKQPCAALWVCGELKEPLKLGWLAHKVVSLVMRFIRSMTNGQAYHSFGDEDERPHLALPAGQIFTVAATPPGEVPPKLGSPEIGALKWQGPGPVSVDTEHTYTFAYRTPWVDLCTWEVLKVPAVSPLPIETVLGGVTELRMLFYDLEAAGSHARCRDGAVLEVVLNRGCAAPAAAAAGEGRALKSQQSALEAWASEHPAALQQTQGTEAEEDVDAVGALRAPMLPGQVEGASVSVAAVA